MWNKVPEPSLYSTTIFSRTRIVNQFLLEEILPSGWEKFLKCFLFPEKFLGDNPTRRLTTRTLIFFSYTIKKKNYHAYLCVCTCVSSCRTSGETVCRKIGTGTASCRSGSAGVWTEWRTSWTFFRTVCIRTVFPRCASTAGNTATCNYNITVECSKNVTQLALSTKSFWVKTKKKNKTIRPVIGRVTAEIYASVPGSS